MDAHEESIPTEYPFEGVCDVIPPRFFTLPSVKKDVTIFIFYIRPEYKLSSIIIYNLNHHFGRMINYILTSIRIGCLVKVSPRLLIIIESIW